MNFGTPPGQDSPDKRYRGGHRRQDRSNRFRGGPGLQDPPTPIATITVTDGATPAITAAKGLRIRIPGTFNMTWDSSDLTAVIGGPAAGKVSNTVGYENGNQTLLITVNTDFAASEWITISGLSFANFTANSPADNLELVTGGAAQTEIDTDDTTIFITDLRISSASSQGFAVGAASTLAATITITDDTVTPFVTKKKDLRIRIPASFPMRWDPSVTNITVGGSAAAKVNTKLKNYEDGGRTAVVNVSADFAAGDQVTISDLRFLDFAAPAAFDNLELEVFKDGLLSALDDKTVNIIAGPVNILSDEDQSFGFSDIATTVSPITVADSATPAITAANDIRIHIPDAIQIVWDSSATTAILAGPAASRVASTVSYEDLGKTLVLNVTSNFVADDYIVIAGLRYTGFAPPSGLDFLELLIDGGTVVIDTDDHSLSLHGAFISSALDQTFIVNAAPKQAETITITDDTVNKTITKKRDLRIRIPAGFSMTWDTSITTVTLGGGAKNKVSTTLKAYEDNGQTVVLDVKKGFAAGEVLTIDGLFFANFSLPSGALPVTDKLELEVGNDGSVAATDVKTITVNQGPTTLTSGSDQVFYVGDAPTTASIFTIINDSAATQIKKKTDIRVTIPAAVDMTWDPSVVTITVGGNAWDKVKNAVTYENVGGKPKILVIDVSGDFGIGDYITVDGLQFRDFLAPVGAGNLLLTADPGPVDTDDFFVAVVELGLSSASSQSFFVSDLPTAASTFTVSDDAVTPQITALDDIRIRIPAGFNMTWDSAESAVALGGSAAAKVDTQILAYEDLDHTLVLDVTTDFAAGDTLIVNGVKFANFTAVSAADNLELEVYNDDNPRTLDDKTVTVATPVSPTLLSAFDQVFPVGAPVTSAATLTIANGTGAAIKDADNIRIRIPAGFNMSWDTSVGTVTLGGSASGKVNVNLPALREWRTDARPRGHRRFHSRRVHHGFRAGFHRLFRPLRRHQPRAARRRRRRVCRRRRRSLHRRHRCEPLFRRDSVLRRRQRSDPHPGAYDYQRFGLQCHHRWERHSNPYPAGLQHALGCERHICSAGRQCSSSRLLHRLVRGFWSDPRTQRCLGLRALGYAHRKGAELRPVHRCLALGPSRARAWKRQCRHCARRRDHHDRRGHLPLDRNDDGKPLHRTRCHRGCRRLHH